MTRLFVATWPPPEVVAVLKDLDRPAVPGVRWSTPEQWMVKVRPLGHVDQRVVPALVEVLEAELDGAPAAECVLGPATRWLGGQWLGAPVAGLEELAAVVFDATGELVPVTHPQPFRADVVLARGRVPKRLAGLPVSAAWTARSVALVADRSAPGLARYQDLDVIPLGVADPPGAHRTPTGRLPPARPPWMIARRTPPGGGSRCASGTTWW